MSLLQLLHLTIWYMLIIKESTKHNNLIFLAQASKFNSDYNFLFFLFKASLNFFNSSISSKSFNLLTSTFPTSLTSSASTKSDHMYHHRANMNISRRVFIYYDCSCNSITSCEFPNHTFFLVYFSYRRKAWKWVSYPLI